MWGVEDDSKGVLQLACERISGLFYGVAPFNSENGAPDFIQNSIPVFLGLCVLEFITGLIVKGKSLYRLNDFLCSVSLGMFMTVVSMFARFIHIPLYAYIYEHLRLIDWSGMIDDPNWIPVVWFFALIVVDLSYYWFHRLSHEWQGLWTAHRVHHSGEDMNLATALRQGSWQPFFSNFMHLASAFMGLPVSWYMTHQSLNTLSQFWIHTELVGRLPFGLEYVLNSASHHRLHHHYPGNCNYAGLLIIWDRMFGTFVAETHQSDNYGLAEQMQTFNPLKVNWMGLELFWGKRLKGRFFARRARHQWTYFSIKDLFKPLPVLSKAEPVACVRPKYDGGIGFANTNSPNSLSSKVVLHILAAVLIVVGLYLQILAVSGKISLAKYETPKDVEQMVLQMRSQAAHLLLGTAPLYTICCSVMWFAAGTILDNGAQFSSVELKHLSSAVTAKKGFRGD